MTTLALSALIDIAPRWFSRVGRYWTEFSTGIEEARAMALRYQTLAALSDREPELFAQQRVLEVLRRDAECRNLR